MRSHLFLLACGMLLLTRQGAILAQGPPARTEVPPGVGPAQSAPQPTDAAREPRLDLKYLEGPDGKPVFVPDQVKLNQFLEWLERQRSDETVVPQGSVASVALDGTASEDRVTLTARILVQITRTSDWVRVPLQMVEGTLRQPPTYRGDGEAVAIPYDPETGYGWWFKGKGQHELTLLLSVPQRKQFPNRRLQLSLPTSAASSLKLHVPAPRISAKGTERATVSTQSDGKESTVDVFGLGSRLDLTWQLLPPAAAGEARLEAFTTVGATFVEGETLTLDVTQRVQSLGTQKTFDQLHVRLPPGFEVVRLDGPEDMEPYGPPDKSNQLTLHFRSATTGPVELKWKLQSRIPSLDEPIVLEGFDIDRARIHVGYVAIRVDGNFRLIEQPVEGRFLQRVGIADLPSALRQSESIAAYRFVDRLRVAVQLGKAEPVVGTDATLFLQFNADKVALAGIYSFNVLRGHLTEARLDWPAMKSEGWQIETVDSPADVELHRDIDPETGTITVRFHEPLSGMFDLRLIARRSLGSPDESMNITFPALERTFSAPAALHVFEAENLDVRLSAVGDTNLRPALDSGAARAIPPREFQRESPRMRRQTYRTDGSAARLAAGLKVHPLEVRTTADVELNAVRDGVAVRERLQYDVSYERLSEVVLTADRELRDVRVRIHGPLGNEINAASAFDDQNGMRRLRVALDQPRLGRFDIEVNYNIEIPRQGAADALRKLTIPLVLPEGSSFSAVNVTGRESSEWQIRAGGETAVRLSPGENAAKWKLEGTIDSISLTLGRPTGMAQRGNIPAKALYRTTVAQDGRQSWYVAFRISGNPGDLALKAPENCEGLIVRWDTDRIPFQPVETVADGMQTYRLSIPERSASGSHVLTVEFQVPGERVLSIANWQALSLPRLSNNVRIEQMLCEISLPESLHLFTLPDGYAPEFDWTWSGGFRGRENSWSAEQLESWISERPLEDNLAPAFSANRYVFSRFGDPRELTFSSMSRAGIVLVGAGVSLVLGLGLLRIPGHLHVVTVLCLVFAASIAAVWFTEPILVLLQPALLGILLACGAAVMDKFIQRRRGGQVLTLATPSGFATAASSVRTGSAVGVGSHEQTSIRTALPESVEPVPLAESGIRT